MNKRATTWVLIATLVATPALQVRAEVSERELGRRFLLEARSQLPLVEDPAVQGYVAEVGKKLVRELGPQSFDYRFLVVQHPALNAFAVPGGYVFVFSGLLARVGNDDELAGVLAHEIGHVHAHHIVRQQTEGQVWTVAAILGLLLTAVHPVLGAAGVAPAQTAQPSYSREFEQEADFLGLRYATAAGYDPHALGTFFKQLLIEQRLNPAGVPPYMLTHPLTEDRVAHIDTTINAQKLKTPGGRPAAGKELAEVQAVARAIAEPSEVVIERYKKPVDEHPEDAERQFLLGRVYQTIGQLDAARVAFERCQQSGGLGGRVELPLGSTYVALKQPEKGRELLQKHLARHPDDGYAHLELGKALSDVGDHDGGLKEFERAFRLAPELDEAHRLAGVASGRKGDEINGFYHLALAAELRGELEQAFSHFDRASRLVAPGSPMAQTIEDALKELAPIVRDREREREARQREERGRRRLPFSSAVTR